MEAALAAALSRPLLDVLQELRRLRVTDRQRVFVGILDKRQQLLNLSLILETFLQLITSWLGTLAFAWATVVLLGGFSTVLIRKDFWFTTAIVFIEATKIIGWGPKAKFFLHLPAAIQQRGKLLRSRNPIRNIAGQLTLVSSLITLAPIFPAASCVTLPIIRLVSLARHDYEGTYIDPRKGNVKPALIFFYALVLTQGALLLHLFFIAVDRSVYANKLKNRYFRDDREGKEFVNRYVAHTLATCIENGVVSTTNRTLVSFAAELLQSENINDHVSTVLVLRKLIESDECEDGVVVNEICSSKQLLGRLVNLLSSRSLLIDQDTKRYIAEIFVKLNKNLRLADIPEATNSISSLIDASLIEIELQTFDWALFTEENRPLFLHGFLVLHELALDPENCIEICSTKEAVSRIIAPISHGLHMMIRQDLATAQIVKGSLGVVLKLTSGTGEACRNLRRQISDNCTVIRNILSILRDSTDQAMNILAAEILTRLNLGQQNMRLFQSNIHHLVTVTTIDNDGNSNEYRAVAAELLAHLCEKKREEDAIDLQQVSGSLSAVLKTIISTKNANHNDLQGRTFLASLLGLAVQICSKLMITANAFTQVVTSIPMMDDLSFVRMLVDIIHRSTDNPDVACLAVVKATTKLAIWMMTKNGAAYIPYFQQENILVKLEAAMEAMHRLDRGVILTRRGDENQDFDTLWNIVRSATRILLPAAAPAAPALAPAAAAAPAAPAPAAAAAPPAAPAPAGPADLEPLVLL
ncbi:hypothetical protein C2845_PM13G07300 [Panicum miliaceum]|uniref:Uncharacterized protein n=1 Tax=Panicum miliaceum TaxID=4540 RepID=A0A3L6RH05_PANMI|nr:hypothetical protein C2845_PM13G07300 [Panicum miliaceum]